MSLWKSHGDKPEGQAETRDDTRSDARLVFHDLHGSGLYSKPGATVQQSILTDVAMATSIHVPKPLLEAVDRGSDWSPGFFEKLSAVNSETVAAVDELLVSVRQTRTSKPPRKREKKTRPR
jgi:hypothetical protein